MKYYYISYNSRLCGYEGIIYGDIINIHPFDWVLKQRDKIPDQEHTIISWQEITEEEYNKYKYKI